MPALVVMGVSGCGKTTIAQGVAAAIGGLFLEGDAYHPRANVEKMARGVPLDDTDRAGWLDAIAAALADAMRDGRRPVLACSALKRSYRDRLRRAGAVAFACLQLSRDEAKARVAHRPGHFMPASLVDSQFDTLELPAGEPGVLIVDGTRPPAELVDEIVRWLEGPQP